MLMRQNVNNDVILKSAFFLFLSGHELLLATAGLPSLYGYMSSTD